jgi:hypothetical protein
MLKLAGWVLGAGFFLFPAFLIWARMYEVIVRVVAFILALVVWITLARIPDYFGFAELERSDGWGGLASLVSFAFTIIVPVWAAVRFYQFVTCLYTHWFGSDSDSKQLGKQQVA